MHNFHQFILRENSYKPVKSLARTAFQPFRKTISKPSRPSKKNCIFAFLFLPRHSLLADRQCSIGREGDFPAGLRLEQSPWCKGIKLRFYTSSSEAISRNKATNKPVGYRSKNSLKTATGKGFTEPVLDFALYSAMKFSNRLQTVVCYL